MKIFAKLDENNVVTKVVVVSNDVATNEEAGVSYLRDLYKEPTANWKMTSYNTIGGIHKLGGTPFRKNFAGKNYTYDQTKDAFIPPKPHPSWILNEDIWDWVAPIPYPNTYINNIVNIHNEQIPDTYFWNEETKTWDFQAE